MSVTVRTDGAPSRPAIAAAVAPVLLEGNLANHSVDLSGNQRVVIGGAAVTPAGSTKLLIVTDATPVAVTAISACGTIFVREDTGVVGWPTTNYLVRRPLSGSDSITIPIGERYAFTAPIGKQWQVGDTVGYLQLPAAGSTSFQKDEQG